MTGSLLEEKACGKWAFRIPDPCCKQSLNHVAKTAQKWPTSVQLSSRHACTLSCKVGHIVSLISLFLWCQSSPLNGLIQMFSLHFAKSRGEKHICKWIYQEVWQHVIIFYLYCMIYCKIRWQWLIGVLGQNLAWASHGSTPPQEKTLGDSMATNNKNSGFDPVRWVPWWWAWALCQPPLVFLSRFQQG